RASSLMDVPHAGAQILERAELELLDRALRAPERLGDLADAPLLDEARHDDALLIVREPGDELGEHRAPVGVGVVYFHRGGRLRRGLAALARPALPAVGDGVPGDLQEPGRERNAAPLEAAEVRERMVENLGGQVLGLAAAAGAAGHER